MHFSRLLAVSIVFVFTFFPSVFAQNPEVKTAVVLKRPFTDVLSYPGRIMSGSTMNLRFSVSGNIQQFNFNQGDMIQAGQVIVELDSTDCLLDVRASQNRLLIAENELQKIDYELKKADGKGTSHKVLDFELRRAGLEVEAARIELEAAQAKLKKNSLTVPKNAVLENRYVEPGEFVLRGEPVAKLVEFDSYFVDFGIIEQQLNRISPQQEIFVRVKSLPDEVFSGKIELLLRSIDPDSGKLTVRGRVKNIPSRLVAGMFADVDVVVFSKKQALLVPRDSLFKTPNGGFAVWVVTAQSTLERRKVVVEYDKSLDVAVISDGLEEGLLVVRGHAYDDFKEGVLVRIKD